VPNTHFVLDSHFSEPRRQVIALRKAVANEENSGRCRRHKMKKGPVTITYVIKDAATGPEGGEGLFRLRSARQLRQLRRGNRIDLRSDYHRQLTGMAANACPFTQQSHREVNMDKKERHQQQKEKEREQKKKDEQKYENEVQKRRLPVPAWVMLLGLVLTALALYVWMFWLW